MVVVVRDRAVDICNARSFDKFPCVHGNERRGQRKYTSGFANTKSDGRKPGFAGRDPYVEERPQCHPTRSASDRDRPETRKSSGAGELNERGGVCSSTHCPTLIQSAFCLHLREAYSKTYLIRKAASSFPKLEAALPFKPLKIKVIKKMRVELLACETDQCRDGEQ